MLLTAGFMPVEKAGMIPVISSSRAGRNDFYFCSSRHQRGSSPRRTGQRVSKELGPSSKYQLRRQLSCCIRGDFYAEFRRPFILIAGSVLLAATAVGAGSLAPSKPRFVFKDAQGKTQSAEIVTQYQPKKIVYPLAKVDPKIDPKLCRAATIAEERAHAHSGSRCWHYVKEALVAAGVVNSRPKSELAKEAGQELVSNYGFKKLAVRDPFAAPVGAVLVYGAKRAAGHVEIRTKAGFVSDFRSKKPSPRPLLGVYAKS